MSKVNEEKIKLVMIHGWGFDCGVFDDMRPLLEPSVDMIEINLPGYAQTPWLATEGVRSLSDWVDQQLLEKHAIETTQPLAILAWSMGALLAIDLADRLPDRYRTCTLISGTPCFAQKQSWKNAMPVKVLDGFIEKYLRVPQATLETFNYLISEGSRDQKNWLRELKTMNRYAPDERALRSGLEFLEHADLRENWTALKIPVLGIYGENDTLVPAAVREDLKKLLPTFSSRLIADTGHAPFLTDAQKVANEILAFLEAHA